MTNYDEQRRIVAATRSYTTPAIITLVLYFVLWLPGFIANIVYWRQANRDEQLTGQVPDGKGCLKWLLWVFIILPIVGFVLFSIMVTAGNAAG